MSDDDLPRPQNGLGCPKIGTLPKGYIEQRKASTLKRYRALSDDLEKLCQTLTPEEWERLNAPL